MKAFLKYVASLILITSLIQAGVHLGIEGYGISSYMFKVAGMVLISLPLIKYFGVGD